jgi:hypothetical protein
MKRYKITILVPQIKEILAANDQEATREARRLTHSDDTMPGEPLAILSSVEFVRVEPEPIDFGFSNGESL